MEQKETSSDTLDYEHIIYEVTDEEDPEKSQYFDSIRSSIEKDIAALQDVKDSVNMMRVQVAKLESELMTTMTCSSWKEICELIGVPRPTLMDDSFKLLHADEDSAQP